MNMIGRRKPSYLALAIALAAAAAGSTSSAAAQEARTGAWILRVEPLYVEAYGHDQNVLDVRRGSATEQVEVSTDSGPGYHLEFRRTGEPWGWGVDFFWFSSPQSLPDRRAMGSPGDPVVYRIPAGSFTTGGADEGLYYRLLEDNDIAAWTLDLYALKRLSDTPRRTVDLLLGVRSADFDNDYRAVAGIDNRRGTRLDSSSNYDRMHGPIVGLVGAWHRDKSTLEASGSLSAVLGSADLSSTQSDFVGAFAGEEQEFADVRTFVQPKDVTIPIVELQLKWIRRLGGRTSFNLGLNVASWSDVSVPPGVIPSAGGQDALLENTIVFAGLLAGVEIRF